VPPDDHFSFMSQVRHETEMEFCCGRQPFGFQTGGLRQVSRAKIGWVYAKNRYIFRKNQSLTRAGFGR